MSAEQPNPQDIQPEAIIVERDDCYLSVIFRAEMGQIEKAFILAVLKDKKIYQITQELRIAPSTLRSRIQAIKEDIVRKGSVWPIDSKALPYTLQQIGDIEITKVPKTS